VWGGAPVGADACKWQGGGKRRGAIAENRGGVPGTSGGEARAAVGGNWITASGGTNIHTVAIGPSNGTARQHKNRPPKKGDTACGTSHSCDGFESKRGFEKGQKRVRTAPEWRTGRTGVRGKGGARKENGKGRGNGMGGIGRGHSGAHRRSAAATSRRIAGRRRM
jgi:hypothetical protein